MDQSKSIRTGYFQALDGNVMHEGSPVKICDAFGDGETPYVILTSQTATQTPVKRNKAFDCTIVVDIFAKYNTAKGFDDVEDIAEQIEAIINPENEQDLTLTGFQIVGTQKELDQNLPDKNGSIYIYRKLLRYRHKLFKL
jgi:hypothetical protein